MTTKPGGVLEMAHLNFQSFLRQRSHVRQLDLWVTGNQQLANAAPGVDSSLGKPFSPKEQTREYDDLSNRSPTPWGGLVVKSLAQTTYVDGVRMPGKVENLSVWESWQQNRFDGKQIALNRATIGHGLAFGLALPGRDPLTGNKMAVMRAVSAKRMAAFYDMDEDEWPRFAIECDPIRPEVRGVSEGWHVRLYEDGGKFHYLSCKGNGHEKKDWTYISSEDTGSNVTPVVRFANSLDLEGRTMGEIEPVIPLLSRVDQDTFDRLIVQRFGAWKVRYIAGLAKPATDAERRALAIVLRVEDLLVSPDAKTQFGVLPETSLDGFIAAGDADLRTLSAITQIPPHHLLGLSSNLQAEALAAAEAGLQRKSGDFKMLNGENYEQFLRLVAHLNGNEIEARAYDMQVRWRDTESRSLVQAANALGIIANSLNVPVEMLWERLPGWTDSDSERAKLLVETDGFEALLAEIEAQGKTNPVDGAVDGADRRGG